MANSKYEYVRSFEQPDSLLPNTWIVVRIDGRGFSRFTTNHGFEKPNDRRALDLMNAAAEGVMRELPDLVLAYGVSDEFSFVFHKDCMLFERRQSKLTTTIVSTFTSYYTFLWSNYFCDSPLSSSLPSFDGRAVVYPSNRNLRDYMSWRQVDCHINNLYNTTFWALLQRGGMDARAAEEELKGTVSSDKNEILFSRFGINYNNEPEIYKKGSVLYRDLAPLTPTCPTTPPRTSSHNYHSHHKSNASSPPAFPAISSITQDDTSPTSFFDSAASTPAPRQTSFPHIGSIDTISPPPQPRRTPSKPNIATEKSSSGSVRPSTSTETNTSNHGQNHSASLPTSAGLGAIPQIPLRISSIPSNAAPRKLSFQGSQSLHNLKGKAKADSESPPLPNLARTRSVGEPKGKGKAPANLTITPASPSLVMPASQESKSHSRSKTLDGSGITPQRTYPQHEPPRSARVWDTGNGGTSASGRGAGEGGQALSRTAAERERKKKRKARIVVEHVDIIRDEFWERRPWILRGTAG